MSNPSTIILNKPVGKTPLEMIHLLQEKYPEYRNEVLGYAGRLDPMAEGLLLILVGDMNSQRKELEKLPKRYLCEALFGVQTDTYDLLGKITNTTLPVELTQREVEKSLANFVGTYQQPYPPYSSPRINGHPLFWWARAGRLAEITIPKKEISIESIQLLGWKEVRLKELEEEILVKVSSVAGEFRQNEIVAGWRMFMQAHGAQKTYIAKLEVTCSSGTYMRSLVHELGNTLNTGALAYSIKRVEVGNFTLDQALPITSSRSE